MNRMNRESFSILQNKDIYYNHAKDKTKPTDRQTKHFGQKLHLQYQHFEFHHIWTRKWSSVKFSKYLNFTLHLIFGYQCQLIKRLILLLKGNLLLYLHFCLYKFVKKALWYTII